MEIVPQKQFLHPEIPLRLKIRKDRSSSQVRITSYFFDAHEQLLYIGLSNGVIQYYKKKTGEKRNLYESKEVELQTFGNSNHHHGDITCILIEPVLHNGMLISGSADCNIKIWVKDQQQRKTCYQTLVGHRGTILALAVSVPTDTIVSTSTDQDIKIWRQEPGRELMLYPFYICTQVITEHLLPRHKEIGGMGLWITSIAWKDGDTLQLYAGDSEGSVMILRSSDIENPKFFQEKKNEFVHRLSICGILAVSQENFVFTIAFDHLVKGLDATNGNELFRYKNPNKCNFSCLAWDTSTHELIAGDEQGYIGIWNVYIEKPLYWGPVFPYVTKITGLHLIEEQKIIIVCTETCVQVFEIRRGQRSVDIQGHKGPIISIYSQEANTLNRIHSNEKPRFITAALDNTMRIWDYSEMATTHLIEVPEGNEITCMTYLEVSNLIATGHENGDVTLWNPDIDQHLTPQGSETQLKHTNTITALAPALYKGSEFLLSVGYDAKVCIWEIVEQVLAEKQMQEGAIGMNVFPSLRNTLDTIKGRNDYIPHEDGDELLCVIFSKTSSYIYLGGNSSHIQVWDISNSEFIKTLHGHEDAVVCFAMDQFYLFSGSDDKTIRVWNTVKNEKIDHLYLYTLYGHVSPVRDIMILPVAGSLVSCSHDGNILVWRYQSQEIIKSFDRSDEINCLAFISSLNVILAGTDSNAIITIPIEPEYGDPTGEDQTVDKATRHAEKKKQRAAGDRVEHDEDTESVQSEDLIEEIPDPTEELLQKMLVDQKTKEKEDEDIEI